MRFPWAGIFSFSSNCKVSGSHARINSTYRDRDGDVRRVAGDVLQGIFKKPCWFLRSMAEKCIIWGSSCFAAPCLISQKEAATAINALTMTIADDTTPRTYSPIGLSIRSCMHVACWSLRWSNLMQTSMHLKHACHLEINNIHNVHATLNNNERLNCLYYTY